MHQDLYNKQLRLINETSCNLADTCKQPRHWIVFYRFNGQILGTRPAVLKMHSFVHTPIKPMKCSNNTIQLGTPPTGPVSFFL